MAELKIRSTNGRGKLFQSVLDTVGDTPAVRINNLSPDDVTLYVKAEAFNPASSVKDRLALNIIEEAERTGALRPGQTVVEASSGNTGIGLAMVCAQKGYPLVVTMPDSFSVERRKLMRMFGAKVVLTPRAERAQGAYRKAVEFAEANGWFLARQFETRANADIHESTTAREIVNDFARSRLDWFVTGYGTGGTLVGIARVLRRERPETRIAVSEPANAQMIGSGTGQQRTPDGAPSASHPAWEPHAIEGWAPDFIPFVLQEAIDSAFYDEVVPIAAAEGVKWAKALARNEGILTGISGGSTFAAALRIADAAPAGSVILCMLPDTGERYLSSSLFDGIEAEMTDEERELSRSTPAAQYPS
jgi:cysteine synthase A